MDCMLNNWLWDGTQHGNCWVGVQMPCALRVTVCWSSKQLYFILYLVFGLIETPADISHFLVYNMHLFTETSGGIIFHKWPNKAVTLFINWFLCYESLHCVCLVNLMMCSLKINQYLTVQLCPILSWFIHPPEVTEKLKNKTVLVFLQQDWFSGIHFSYQMEKVYLLSSNKCFHTRW